MAAHHAIMVALITLANCVTAIRLWKWASDWEERVAAVLGGGVFGAILNLSFVLLLEEGGFWS